MIMLINRRCKNCPKNDTCTNKYKTEIVTDINDLPEDVQTLIITDIKKRLLPQVELSFITGDIEGATQYVNNEIQKADNTIQKIIAEAYNDSHLSYLEKISEIVVYNIERKKMLQQFINDCKSKNPIQETSNEIASIDTKSTKKAQGSPNGSLKNRMIDDTNGVKLQILHDVIQGKKGKDATLVILTAIDLGWMTTPTAKEVKKEFGDIGSQQNFSKYLKEKMFRKEEIEGMKNCLKSKYDHTSSCI